MHRLNREQNETDFEPNEKMLKVLNAALNPDTPAGIAAQCSAAGVSRATWYRWRVTPGFLDWFNDEYRKGLDGVRAALVKVGLQKALEGDFRFWRVMMEKLGEYQPRGQHLSLDNQGQQGCVLYVPFDEEEVQCG